MLISAVVSHTGVVSNKLTHQDTTINMLKPTTSIRWHIITSTPQIITFAAASLNSMTYSSTSTSLAGRSFDNVSVACVNRNCY